jgi:transcriptional regulator with XRE-family HTH domain
MRDRIIAFLKAENKSSSQLAEEIGVQPSGISHIISGRNKPSLDFILKMLEKYKHLSSEWLLFGKGDMYADKAQQDLFFASDEQKLLENMPVEELFTENLKVKGITNPEPEQKLQNDTKIVEKIAWFYSDGSFREYFPSKE